MLKNGLFMVLKKVKNLISPKQPTPYCVVLSLLIAVIEGAIAQSLPEHPKKEFIFSLSTAFGDAYLFQVSVSGQCQVA